MEVSSGGVLINSTKQTDLDGAVYSTGGIALLKDAVLGYKPYDGNTPLPAGNLYTFGRHSQIGDLTHDNDGICLRSSKYRKWLGPTPHRSHLSRSKRS